jgi:hypothetical protein
MAGPTNPGAVSFTAPTKYTNGASIPANGIVRYEYGFGQTAGNYTRIVPDTDFTVAGGKQAGPIPTDLAEGQWFTAQRTVSAGGGVSAWSNEVPFVVVLVPAAVTDFSVA